MVARRQRRQGSMPEIDEHGIPNMEGVDTSSSEDPAVFWGPNWKAELDEAIKEGEQSQRTVYGTLDEFFAALHSDEP